MGYLERRDPTTTDDDGGFLGRPPSLPPPPLPWGGSRPHSRIIPRPPMIPHPSPPLPRTPRIENRPPSCAFFSTFRHAACMHAGRLAGPHVVVVVARLAPLDLSSLGGISLSPPTPPPLLLLLLPVVAALLSSRERVHIVVRILLGTVDSPEVLYFLV